MRLRIPTRLSLPAKISLVLVLVILPTFIVVTITQMKLTLPILEGEIRQVGISSAKTIAARIESSRLLWASSPTQSVENVIQEYLLTQPNIIRMDILVKDPLTGAVKLLVSSVEEEPGTTPLLSTLVNEPMSEYRVDESGQGQWDIYVPIEHHLRDAKNTKRALGMVHVVASTQLISGISKALWRMTAGAAALSVLILIFVLSYFLRKTIANDRLLRKVESKNLHLTEQLHETQRQLLTTEKLAVMGQLTASFAHEIGTPLNALGGHLQILKEEILPAAPHGVEERMGIIQGQLVKIEGIVKGFLLTTAKPPSQKQLADLNRLVEKTLSIVAPRLDSLGIEVQTRFNRTIPPLRIVPLDFEQVLLNLLNNSIDSLAEKLSHSRNQKKIFLLEISSDVVHVLGGEWAQISVFDTGEGIKKMDLKKVVKPFYTTKRPGEGTGLGLTICQEIIKKYDGELLIDSKEGAWTRVTLRLPYHFEK